MHEGDPNKNLRGNEHQPQNIANQSIPEDANDLSEGMSPEKAEEMKLRAKFPTQVKGGPSQFLQKRLQQRKFFDSGDYNMAKAKGLKLPPGPLAQVQAQNRPIPPQPNLQVEELRDGSASPTGSEIPTPATVPSRKTSIVNQQAVNKLSPQPIHHQIPDQSPLTCIE